MNIYLTKKMFHMKVVDLNQVYILYYLYDETLLKNQ
jgi:hypothetical protein